VAEPSLEQTASGITLWPSEHLRRHGLRNEQLIGQVNQEPALTDPRQCYQG
jgi:hypothetical protein